MLAHLLKSMRTFVKYFIPKAAIIYRFRAKKVYCAGPKSGFFYCFKPLYIKLMIAIKRERKGIKRIPCYK